MQADTKHDHIKNGIAPVEGCEICDLIVKSALHDVDKEPDGRMPPWLWEKERDDK
jgi:hypothetical protein